MERGGEVLFVEGQGSLLHPAYSGVTLGLIHGSRHTPTSCATWRARRSSTATSASRSRRSPSWSTLHERISLLPRPARVLAVALNTRLLDDDAARRAIEETEAETGLPADDPVRFGAGRLVDSLEPSDQEEGRSEALKKGLGPTRGRADEAEAGPKEEAVRRGRARPGDSAHRDVSRGSRPQEG